MFFKMVSFQGVVVLLASVLVATDASCWFSPIKNETSFFGSKRFYCEYSSHAEPTDNQTSLSNDTRVRINVTVGSTFDTLDCEHCQCRRDGLHCCGTGFYAGTFQVPKKCDVIPDGCEPIIVLAEDHKLNCFTKKPIRPNQYGMMHVSNTGPERMDKIVRRVFHSSSGDSEKPKVRTQPMVVANRQNSHWPDNFLGDMVTMNPSVWPIQNQPRSSSNSRSFRVSSRSDNTPVGQSSRSVLVPSGSPMVWPISQDPQTTFSRSISMRRTNEAFPESKQEVVPKQNADKPSTDMELNRLLAMKLLGLA
ncbi:uncharacterized protein LOC110464434 [Mizuhopecten yessoensis]|uniref:Beta-microseminoprotein n=1 Tax=Mizuhopecten yessoensis TaxID=6573 RepID=A0A210PU00_MIZYE|nr:uncharacterized protein LOC110464434 [Mizuhopecten yessoensis]OWF39963.1 Beta-microseminoprotein [Mizuhopecten yessoensis]